MQAFIILGAAITLGAPAAKDALKNDNDIVGEWVVESIQANGKARSLGDEPLRYQLTADGKWSVYRGERKLDTGGRYAVDPKASPATIDLDPNPGADDTHVIAGIYKVEGDKLTWCQAFTSRPTRPTSFESTVDSGAALYVFKRAKPKK